MVLTVRSPRRAHPPGVDPVKGDVMADKDRLVVHVAAFSSVPDAEQALANVRRRPDLAHPVRPYLRQHAERLSGLTAQEWPSRDDRNILGMHPTEGRCR